MLNRPSRAAFVALLMTVLLAATQSVALAQPVNDEPSNAIEIPELPFNDVRPTHDATVGDEDTCFGDTATVWYSFTPSVDVPLYIDTIGSDYDTTLSVYTGSPESLERVTCVDDTFSGTSANLYLTAQAGTTYFIMAGACCEGPGGTLVISVVVREPPPPPQLSFSVDPVGQFDSVTGAATISGTVSCEGGDYISIGMVVRQRWGRRLITGSHYDEIFCDGTESWSVTVQGDGVFAGGRAQVEYYAASCNETDCTFVDGRQLVRLRGGGRVSR